jgi:hypothetical protein
MVHCRVVDKPKISKSPMGTALGLRRSKNKRNGFPQSSFGQRLGENPYEIG